MKKWEVKNLSKERWAGLKLRCIDETLDVKKLDGTGDISIPVPNLQSQALEVAIPDTRSTEIARISVKFVAPDQPGATVSHWRFYRGERLLEGGGYPKLDCLVKVVDSVR